MQIGISSRSVLMRSNLPSKKFWCNADPGESNLEAMPAERQPNYTSDSHDDGLGSLLPIECVRGRATNALTGE